MTRKLSDSERRAAEARIRADRRLFDETKNPLFAWAALLDARYPVQTRGHVKPLPMPEWVYKHLAEVAKALLGGFVEGQAVIAAADLPRGQRPAAVAVALGLLPKRKLTGRPSLDAFDAFRETRDLSLALDLQWHRRGGATYADARDEAAEEAHISASVVDRAWKRHGATVRDTGGVCSALLRSGR